MLTGTAHSQELEADPIPADWIEAGAPQARSKQLSTTPDARLKSGLWDCSAGRFKWVFEFDEIVQILEGEVIVEANGVHRKLVAGDVAHFPYGLTTHWHVPKYVKKFWTQRFPNRLVRLLRGPGKFS